MPFGKRGRGGQEGKEEVQDRALMERGWPGYNRPAAIQTASFSNPGKRTDPHICENSVPIEPNNSQSHEPHDSSSQIWEDACSLPYSNDQSTGESIGRIHSWQAASTSTKYDNWATWRIEQRRLGTVNWVLEETARQSPHQEGDDW